MKIGKSDLPIKLTTIKIIAVKRQATPAKVNSFALLRLIERVEIVNQKIPAVKADKKQSVRTFPLERFD